MTKLMRIHLSLTCILLTIQKVQLSTEPISSIKNTSDIERHNNNTTKNSNLTQRRNNNLLDDTKQFGKKTRFVRSPNKNQPTNKSELQPEGYIYDINHCQYIDDRVVCGYDKNPQEPKKKDVVDLDDNCRKHGDRIECGYVNGPFPDAYNPDPKKDNIANIDLLKYSGIERSGNNPENNDAYDDSNDALRMGKAPNPLQTEVVKLRQVISQLVDVLSANTNGTSTVPTPTTSNATTAPPITDVVKENPAALSLSEILRSGRETSRSTKLTLSDLVNTEFTTPGQRFENKAQKKCIEKGGRIFCPT